METSCPDDLHYTSLPAQKHYPIILGGKNRLIDISQLRCVTVNIAREFGKEEETQPGEFSVSFSTSIRQSKDEFNLLLFSSSTSFVRLLRSAFLLRRRTKLRRRRRTNKAY